jgi:hypothetical protein
MANGELCREKGMDEKKRMKNCRLERNNTCLNAHNFEFLSDLVAKEDFFY